MIKGVVCINPSDAYNYLANSYRPYQQRNNNLAAKKNGNMTSKPLCTITF